MPETRRFLVELGTEELPPKALRGLSDAFGAGLRRSLEEASLGFDSLTCFATPRRLAVRVEGLAATQPDRQIDRRGPPVGVALDEAGNATKAGLKFAESCGIPFAEIGRISTDKGEYLHHTVPVPGAAAETLLPDLVAEAVAALPIPRRAGDTGSPLPCAPAALAPRRRRLPGPTRARGARHRRFRRQTPDRRLGRRRACSEPGWQSGV